MERDEANGERKSHKNNGNISASPKTLACRDQLVWVARILEAVAYDLAGEVSSVRVASLILVSAEIDRIAERIRRSDTDARADETGGIH